MKAIILSGAALLALPIGGAQAQANPEQEPAADAKIELLPDDTGAGLTDAEIQQLWGVFAYLPGNYFEWTVAGRDSKSAEQPKTRTIRRYKWRERGRVLEQWSGINVTRWELGPGSRLIRKDPVTGEHTDEQWSIEQDGSVTMVSPWGDETLIRSFKAEGPEHIQVLTRVVGRGEVTVTDELRRLNDPAAALAPSPGVFVAKDDMALIISFEGQVMTVSGPYGRDQYHRQSDGRFLLNDGSREMRFLNGDTIEYVSTRTPESLPGLAMRAPPEMQMPKLAYGKYNREGFEDDPAVTVLEYRGDALRLGARSSPMTDYVLKSDGKYHSPYGSGTYRIIDMYTVEYGPPAGYGGPEYPTYRLVRVDDASPTFFAEETAKWNEWFGEYKAADDARWAAAEEERLALEQEQAEREWESQQASANAGGIMGAVLRGWTEATAKNEAMERSMRESANAAIARGTAQYARDRDSSDRDSSDRVSGDRGSSLNRQPGLTIENRAEPTIAAREPAEPQTRQTYAWCMALRPNQNVTYSSVQQITIPNRGWSDSSMAQGFGAVAGGGVSVCSNADSHAAAQAQLDSSKTQHRGIRQTTTSAILRP